MSRALCRKPVNQSDGWRYCANKSGHDSICWPDDAKIAERPVVTLGTEWPSESPKLDGTEPLKIEIWRTVVVDGKDTGFVKYDKGRPIRDIFAELRHVLDQEELVDEYFHISHEVEYDRARPGPRIEDVYEFRGKWCVRFTPPGVTYAVTEEFSERDKAEEHRQRLVKLYRPIKPIEYERVGLEELPLWPHGYRFLACYAVTGGSEGHYVHVETQHVTEWTAVGPICTPRRIFTGKTFRGMEHAQKIAAWCAFLLGA